MTLAAPAWLWLLTAAPLIVLLHLRRHRPIEVPTTKLWRLVAEGADRPQRLRRPPATVSLLLQLVILALAAVTLAEPSNRASNNSNPHVLILDASAAMAVVDDETGVTMFRSAIEAWLAEMASIDATGPFSVWWVGPWTRPLAHELPTVASVRSALVTATPSDGGSDWGTAAVRTAGVFVDGSEITVVTTEPEVAARALSNVAQDEGTSLEIVGVGGLSWDLLLEPLAVTRLDAGSDALWSVEGAVRFVGAAASMPATVNVTIGFQPADSMTILPFWSESVRFNRVGRAVFRTDLKLPGAGHLKVAIVAHGGDSLEARAVESRTGARSGVDSYAGDDVRWLQLDPDPEPPLVVVLTSLGSASPTARALEATASYRVASVAAWPQGVRPALAVVEAMPDPFLGESTADRPPSVLWIGSEPGTASVPEFSADPGVTTWNRTHPASAGTNWGSLDVARATTIVTTDGAEPLVNGVAHDLVQVRASTRGRDIVVAFDPSDTTWTESTQFLTFVTDSARWLAPAPQSVTACHVGVACRLSWEMATSGVTATLDERTAWALAAWNDGPLPSTMTDAWRPDMAGLWKLTSNDGQVEHIAVLPAPSAALSIERAVRSEADPPARSERVFRVNLTVLFGLLLAALVAAESLVAGRRVERFWRRSALTRSGASGVRSRLVAAGHIAVICVLLASLVRAPWPTYSDPRVLVVIAKSAYAAAEALPDAYADWPADQRVDISLVTPDGAIDEARAFEMAAAATPPNIPSRVAVVPLSSTTRSAAIPLLALVGTTRVAIDSTPLEPVRQGDAAVIYLAPTTAPLAGSAFELHAVIAATSATTARVRLQQDAETVSEVELAVLTGTTLVTVPVEGMPAGTVRYTLTVSVDGDSQPLNDAADVVVEVRAPPNVMLFAAASHEADELKRALELQGFTVVTRPPHTMGLEPSAFLGYDSVVLMDVPAIDLSSTQQEALELWVRDFGGGLALVGGEHAFGPGGYLETALDRVSPLSSRVPREAPEVAMLFVLDRSGSMQQTVDGTSRLDVAKQATLTAISLLGEGSQVAIVAYDDTAHTVLEFTNSAQLDVITEAISPLVPGGGTAVYPALVTAAEMLQSSDSASRHVIVLTDGLSQPDDIRGVMAQIVAAEATVSAIAIGVGSDVERVREIADLGGGTAHITTDFRALPGILAQEAMLLSGDPVVRQTVTPMTTGDRSALMEGLPDVFPPLTSFVETTPKSAASVHLADVDGRPLLASWRYGSGRVLAYTSQAVGNWSEAWNQVNAFPGWWGQWLRWTVQPTSTEGLDLSTSVTGDEVLVEVTASGPDGSPLTGLDLQATARPSEPDAGGLPDTGLEPSVSAALAQVEPGRYVGMLPISVGDTIIEASEVGPDATLEPATRMVAHPYMAWLVPELASTDHLAILRAQTGGRLLTADDVPWPGSGREWSMPRLFRPWLVVALGAWGVTLILRYAPPRWTSRSLKSRTDSSTRSSTSA